MSKKNKLENYSEAFALSKIESLRSKLSNDLFNICGENPKKAIIDIYNYQYIQLDTCIKNFHNNMNIYPCCKKGCSWCCNYPILTTEPEYLTIKSWISTNLSTVEKQNLNDRLSYWTSLVDKNILKGLAVKKTIGNLGTIVAFSDMAAYEKYTKSNTGCPFLVDNNCSIYQVRPISCRIFFSYNNKNTCVKEEGTLSYECMRIYNFMDPIFYLLKKSITDRKTLVIYNDLFFKSKILPLWFCNTLN